MIKRLNTIRYILFALMILGMFANFAQNEYGGRIINLCNTFMTLVSLVLVVYYERLLWKEKRSAALLLILLLISFLLMFLLILVAPDLGDVLIFSFLVTVPPVILVIESIIVNVRNWKRSEPDPGFHALENFAMVLLLGGTQVKNMHWPGASIMLITGAMVMVFLFFPRMLRLLTHEFSKGPVMTLFTLLFYIDIVSGSLFFVFKYQHWPGSVILLSVTSLILALLMLPLIFNIKLRYQQERLTVNQYYNKSQWISLFAFIYINYFTVFIFFQAIGVGPKYFSIGHPPAYERMVEQSNGQYNEQATNYLENFENFIANRSSDH
jgi:hypothetical protein